jgi:hypothetical protein
MTEKNEHRTSNVQRRILNKVFCQFINWRSGATSLFDVRRSMFNVGRSSFKTTTYCINATCERLQNNLALINNVPYITVRWQAFQKEGGNV